tara:strand:+ start:14563 stop:15471 length:909 start_codon:yes stop_codon:yes gene_type:complete
MKFNFSLFKNKASLRYFKQYDDCFLSWFVGFSEGDASFILSKKRNFFMINQKDPKVLFLIKEKLGFGRVKGPYTNKSDSNSYFRYIISDKESCYFLSLLFKQNLVLNKTNKRFNLWESNLKDDNLLAIIEDNEYIKTNELLEINKLLKTQNSFKTLKTDESFQDNSWLSGFIDAEGCFSITSVKSKDRLAEKRFRVKFSLGQSEEKNVLLKIKEDLKVGYLESSIKNSTKDSSGHSIYVISSLSSIKVIINYLNKYNLKSNKNISFVRWCKLIIRLTDGESRQFGTRAYSRMERLAKEINVF